MKKNKTNLPEIPICAIVEKGKASFEIIIYETQNGKEPFNQWLDSLDGSVRGKVLARIDRITAGLFGSSKALKDGLCELKFKNPALRIYYSIVGKLVVLLISGGDKSTQSKDINKAKEYLEDYRSRHDSKKE